MGSEAPSPLQKLLDLGLTEYQAKVYLALLKTGSATASQLTSQCDVPRTRIYPTMEQLHGKGLVKVLPETPIRYQPVSIQEFIERRAEEMRNRAEELVALKEVYAKSLPVQGAGAPVPGGSFEVYRGRDSVREKLVHMWNGARSSIDFVGLGHAPPRLMGKLYTIAREKREAGVKIRFLFPIKTPDMGKVTSALSDFEVRFILEAPPSEVCTVDRRELLLIHRIPDDPDPYQGQDAAIWSDDGAFTEGRVKLFEASWKEASSPDHPTLAMVPSALRDWLEVPGVKPKSVLEEVARTLGVQIASAVKGDTVPAILKELNSMFTESGCTHVGRGKGGRVVVRCRYHDITGSCPEYDTFCPTLLQTILRVKLGEDAVEETAHDPDEGCVIRLK